MPDRHGPLKVVYQKRGEEIPPSLWSEFESDTPNDVLDRITRGILQTEPQWLGEQLSSGEITAVEEFFGVSIGAPGDGGEVELPADRFSVDVFDGSATFVEGGITNLFYQVTVSDADDDDDVTGFRLDATGDEGATDSFEYLPDGPASGQQERSDFEAGLFVEGTAVPPVDVTLSAADEDSAGGFVELITQQFDPSPPS
jgi:hypothetical protein